MNTEEAVKICREWFAHLDRQRDRAVQMQKWATMARQGPQQHQKARRELAKLEREAPTVFDGAYLEPAVRHLIKLATGEE